MWCAVCNKDLVKCVCPDIEERLTSLAGTPAAPAAAMNLMRRMATQDKDSKAVPKLLLKKTTKRKRR
jgi:hypothetical protein